MGTSETRPTAVGIMVVADAGVTAIKANYFQWRPGDRQPGSFFGIDGFDFSRR